MRRLVVLVGVVGWLLLPGFASAHQGGIDSNGGHHCRQRGFDSGLCSPVNSYHCHQPGCVDRDGASGASQPRGDVAAAPVDIDGPRTPRSPRTPRVPGSDPRPRPVSDESSGSSGGRELPRTGSATVVIALSGLGFLGSGTVLLTLKRRIERRLTQHIRRVRKLVEPVSNLEMLLLAVVGVIWTGVAALLMK